MNEGLHLMFKIMGYTGIVLGTLGTAFALWVTGISTGTIPFLIIIIISIGILWVNKKEKMK